MAKKEKLGRLPRPELVPPINTEGKIKVISIGKPKITSPDIRVEIERRS